MAWRKWRGGWIAGALVGLAGCQSLPPTHSARVYCSGGQGCAFEPLHQQQRDAQPNPDVDMQRYLHVPAGMQQVRVRFYPVTLARAEPFVLIHSFQAGQVYHLHQYREREQQPSTLLAAATPDPLCVELLENQRQIRRFCRPFDPQTGLGEFIEQRVTP